MLTSLMLVGASPGTQPKSPFLDDHRRDAEHRIAEISPSSPDAEERIARMRPIDVDLDVSCAECVDTVGSPIWYVNDDVLAAFDRAVIRCERRDDDRADMAFDSDDDEKFDFGPAHMHGATDESSRELRVHADDPNEMSLGIFGGCASTVKYAELERQRVREPIETISFYL